MIVAWPNLMRPASSSRTSSQLSSIADVSSIVGAWSIVGLWSIVGFWSIVDVHRSRGGGVPNWTSTEWPTERTEQGFGDARLNDNEVATIRTAVGTVTEARNAHAAGRKVLVFLGVGVDNPTSVFGSNNSASPRFDARAQVSPPLLRDAIRQAFYVVGLNFNTASAAQPEPLPPADGVHLHVTAPFPLQAGSPTNREALALIKGLVATANRLVVLNCVTDVPYAGLLDLVKSAATRKAFDAEQCLPAVYAVSYAEAGKQEVIAPSPIPKRALRKSTGLTSVKEVFPTFADLDG
jgi:hypothetical protein